MSTTHEVPRALRIGQRIDRLGISEREFAVLARVDRGTIRKIRAGEKVRSSSIGKVEAQLDQLERDVGLDLPPSSEVVSTIALPDGTQVTFSGLDPEAAAQAASEFLRRRAEGV